ncbi:peroxiredoxin family protein [Pedobacter xixiisoli]|uniref:AhpC/TSA family protein n=1 Tax=Pedobacter xixiisoli TaxID=1476464 RepID=A0A285ZUL5_9SPHI|nr:redoxin domain-containing protein [Pedobacter xixiisoli]SOD13326.1 AhpC/TSA family protein [Pedobacter xixiisoli]
MKKMKNLIFAALALVFTACNSAPKEETMEEKLATYNKSKIDLLMGAKPEFSAKTTDGSVFNSKDNKGKYWVLFVYDSGSIAKSESYDMAAELNKTYELFGDKIPMVGLVNGFSDDEPALQKLFAEAKFSFKQIDNTEGPNKEKPLNDNVFCTPAKILIDPNGKVVYNGCGGKTQTFDYKLDSLVKAGL